MSIDYIPKQRKVKKEKKSNKDDIYNYVSQIEIGASCQHGGEREEVMMRGAERTGVK